MLNIVDNGKNNTISGDTSALGGQVLFHGDNIVLQFPDRALSGQVDIHVYNRNAEINLTGLARFGHIKIISKNGGSIYIRKNSTIESIYFLADKANIYVGKDCMISYGVTLRTTDAHGIYDSSTGSLLNAPARIHLGHHVWIGQEALISKNVTIGTGSVVGARSFISNQDIEKNAIYAGAPARLIRTGIIWDRHMTENLFHEKAKMGRSLRDNFSQWAGRDLTTD